MAENETLQALVKGVKASKGRRVTVRRDDLAKALGPKAGPFINEHGVGSSKGNVSIDCSEFLKAAGVN